VVHQPHGNLGDESGPFFDLDAIELVDRKLSSSAQVTFVGFITETYRECVHFKAAQFAVGEYEKVATPTGGIEELERAEALDELIELAWCAFGFFEIGLELVKKQLANELENVAFGCVMGTDLSALARLHDGLKKRAKHSGANRFPFEPGAGKQILTHGSAKVGEGKVFGKKIAVNVRQFAKVFVEGFLTAIFECIEDIEHPCKMHA